VLNDAIDRLLRALIDGVLKAVVLTVMGNIFPLPVEFWRSQFGREGICCGWVKWWLEGQPLLERRELDRWNNADATAGDEQRLKRWLVRQMLATPDKPRSKAVMVEEARTEGLRFTPTMFNRAWPEAAREANTTKWTGPGRRSKRRTGSGPD
jgi:hypothetical protein